MKLKGAKGRITGLPWGVTYGLASAALLAVACAHESEMVWNKPGGTDADFYRMRAFCVNQAKTGALPAKEATARFVACMQSDGWVQVPTAEAKRSNFVWVRDDGTPALGEELDAAKKECKRTSSDEPSSPLYGPNIMLCVQSKGYQLVEDKQ